MKERGSAFQNLMPERRHLVSDLIAGLTFAVVNVPQAMGHALLATVNPVLGIYTLMVAAPVAALFTSSVFMNVSTTAALSVAAGADLAGVPDSERAEALAVLVLLVGGIQLAAGLFRLGFLVRFVSNAVMTGFLNGVAALIVLGQVGHLTGFASGYSNQLAQRWTSCCISAKSMFRRWLSAAWGLAGSHSCSRPDCVNSPLSSGLRQRPPCSPC